MNFLDLIGLLMAGFMVSVFIYYNIVTRLDMDIDDVEYDEE
tara:strand:+ start:296 stop:418 length:123 start_codon:yes stop_codon:yes gene_type:complete